MKHTTLISESEKRRILNLHENVIREEFNLIMEQSSEELKKFFEDQKTKFRNFPVVKVRATNKRCQVIVIY